MQNRPLYDARAKCAWVDGCSNLDERLPRVFDCTPASCIHQVLVARARRAVLVQELRAADRRAGWRLHGEAGVSVCGGYRVDEKGRALTAGHG